MKYEVKIQQWLQTCIGCHLEDHAIYFHQGSATSSTKESILNRQERLTFQFPLGTSSTGESPLLGPCVVEAKIAHGEASLLRAAAVEGR